MSDEKNSNNMNETDEIKVDTTPDSTVLNNSAPDEENNTSKKQSKKKKDQKVDSAINTEKTTDDILSSDTSFQVNDSGEIVIDNTTEQTPAEPPVQELERKVKLKEPIDKKKKIMIISIAAATLVVLFCVIFFPCYFFFKGKIMIGKAEDFSPESGKYFVLKKDITVDGNLNLSNSECSIDLDGNTLEVRGTLTLATTKTATIYIGTKDGDEYKSKGLLRANKLVIDAKNASIIFASTVITDEVLIKNAKNITIAGLSANNSFVVENANKITVNQAIAVGTSGNMSITNCNDFYVKGGISSNELQLNGLTHATFTGTSFAKNVILDGSATMQLKGSVTSITGGAKVALLQGYKCGKCTNVAALAIYTNSYKTTIVNSPKVVWIEKLATPIDLIVDTTSGSFIATAARNQDCALASYVFYLDDEVHNNSTSSTRDITSWLRDNGASTHKIGVSLKGDYNFDTFDTATNGSTLYLDSDKKTISYSYSLQLATPKNLSINSDKLLTFDAVDFADGYIVYVDGKIVGQPTAPSFDLTNYVKKLGYHAIRVVARSTQKELKTSDVAMAEYKTVQQLAQTTVTASYTQNLDATEYTITINLSKVDNAKKYKITIDGEVIYISGTTFSYSTTANPAGKTVSVQVEGYGFYTDSEIATTTLAIA